MAGRNDFEDYIRRARKIIRTHGWMVQGVLPDANQTSFSYSVGLSESFRHPEIYIVGLHPEPARGIINAAGTNVRLGQRFDRPCLSDTVIADYPVAFRPIERASCVEHSTAGRAILGREFDGVQLVIPDVKGFFPWDRECNPKYAAMQTSLLSPVGKPPSCQ
jgi:hypothetical protein